LMAWLDRRNLRKVEAWLQRSPVTVRHETKVSIISVGSRE
jgi:hypothetical protein